MYRVIRLSQELRMPVTIQRKTWFNRLKEPEKTYAYCRFVKEYVCHVDEPVMDMFRADALKYITHLADSGDPWFNHWRIVDPCSKDNILTAFNCKLVSSGDATIFGNPDVIYSWNIMEMRMERAMKYLTPDQFAILLANLPCQVNSGRNIGR